MPVFSSSRISRRRASAWLSPSCTLPPGNSQYPARCVPVSRRAMRNRPCSRRPPPRPQSDQTRVSFSGLCGYAEQSGAMGTDQAFGFSRGAEGRTEVHQGLIEIERAAPRHERRRDAPQVLFGRVRFRHSLSDEHAKQHSRHIGVQDRGALAKGEAANRAGGIGADAFEGQQRGLVRRQAASVRCDRPLVQSPADVSA
jgi:hypothetical protein